MDGEKEEQYMEEGEEDKIMMEELETALGKMKTKMEKRQEFIKSL